MRPPMTTPLTTLALAAVAVALAAHPAWAHKPSDAHLRLTADGAQLTGRLDVAVRDLDGALALDADGDGAITWAELTAAAPRITAYVAPRLAIAGDGAPCPLALGAPALTELSDGTYWAAPVTARCPRPARALAVRYGLLFEVDALHRGLIHVAGQTAIARDDRPLRLTLDDDAGPAAFVREGVWHIWQGADHVLFLICLILPAVFQRRSQRWAAADSLRDVVREVLEIVTAFTLAHSITLILAATGWVRLPSRVIETAIALSVVAAAVNNLARTIDARWAVAFALGLLHGFGFSSVLVDLGLPSRQLVGALLGFNLGVELGQLAIVLIALPLAWLCARELGADRYRTRVMPALSLGIAVIGGLWLVERALGISLISPAGM